MENQSKAMGVIALILGILSLITCGCCFPAGIIAIILAIIVLVKKKGGKVLAIIGMILSVISIILITISTIMFMPLKDSYMDFVQNADSYIEEYEEDGTYPEFVEKFADMANLEGDAREEYMKALMDTFSKSINSVK